MYMQGEFVMRKLTSLIIVLLISLFLCSCMGEKVSKYTSQSSETDESLINNPTGVSEGQIQQPTIYYQGNLYSYSFQGFQTTLASRYALIGVVKDVDLYNMPTEDFCATGVDLQSGQEVYAETTDCPSLIFVDLSDTYMPLTLVSNNDSSDVEIDDEKYQSTSTESDSTSSEENTTTVQQVDMESIEALIKDYYEKTVFDVETMELKSKTAGSIVYTICASKDGVVQEPAIFHSFKVKGWNMAGCK